MDLGSYEDSTKYIFGERLGDGVTDTLLAEIRQAGAAGKTRTELHRALGNNVKAARILAALEGLHEAGLITAKRRSDTQGAPATVYLAAEHAVEPEART